MPFPQFDGEDRFRAGWKAVRVARPVRYTLFTFGSSELAYYLVEDSERPREPVRLTRGEVKVTRPMIITPGSDRPEFEGFFENQEFEGLVSFLMARTAAFSNLRWDPLESTCRHASLSIL